LGVGSFTKTHFKGWAKPGPIPPGALSPPDVPPEESLDAISGHFRIFQLRDGHRFSTDDVLTAWYGTSWVPTASRVLDLGSGIGSVGMIAAWRLPGARIVAIEAQEDSIRLARKSAAYNGLDSELRGDIADYARIAARHLAVGGVFACVFPEDQRERLETAARAADTSIVRRRPVVFRAGEGPLVALFLLMRATDLPAGFRERTWVEPPLIIRAADGSVHPEYAAVKLSVGFPP